MSSGSLTYRSLSNSNSKYTVSFSTCRLDKTLDELRQAPVGLLDRPIHTIVDIPELLLGWTGRLHTKGQVTWDIFPVLAVTIVGWHS